MHQSPLAADAAERAGTATAPASLLLVPAADAAGTVDFPNLSTYFVDRLLYFLNPYKTPPQVNPSSIVDFLLLVGEVAMDNYFYSQ